MLAENIPTGVRPQARPAPAAGLRPLLVDRRQSTASVSVRCTADGDRTRWRRVGAIVGTLLHELAHVRYRSHGPRFWALHRRLVDRAVAAGRVRSRSIATRPNAVAVTRSWPTSAARPIALAARHGAPRASPRQPQRAESLAAWRSRAHRPAGGRDSAGTVVRVLALGRSPSAGRDRRPAALWHRADRTHCHLNERIGWGEFR